MLRRSRALNAASIALLGIACLAASPPQELGPKSVPQDILRCERNYVYRQKTLPCDSPTSADGEGLRPLLDAVPAAQQELEIYQANRRGLNLTAYTGMAGLLVAALGPRFFENRGSKNVIVGIGLSFTLSSLAFGRYRLMANEAHLDRAVRRFNEANPGDPITLLQPSARPVPTPTSAPVR